MASPSGLHDAATTPPPRTPTSSKEGTGEVCKSNKCPLDRPRVKAPTSGEKTAAVMAASNGSSQSAVGANVSISAIHKTCRIKMLIY